MKCNCSTELKMNKDLVYCPKCGWSFTIELIKKLFRFVNNGESRKEYYKFNELSEDAKQNALSKQEFANEKG